MSSDKKPRPTDVGQSFVKTYSKALETDPASVAHFFKDESLFTHKESNEAAEIVDRGRESITKRIKSLEINEAVVDFQSMDCQEGYSGGVLIVLTGELKKRGTSKHFAQTFFLAPQEPAGYYIHNYIFRVLKEHPHTDAATAPAAAQHHPAPAATPAPAAAAPAAASSPAPPAATKEHPPKKEAKKERKPAAAAAAATANGSAEAATAPAAPAAAPAPAATAAAPAPAAATAAAPAASNKKKPSWASVASSASLNAPAAAASPATEKAPSKTAPSKPTQAAAASTSAPAATAGGAAAAGAAAAGAVRNNPAAVFVKNLPFEVSLDELQNEFSKYGKVRSLSPRKGFAFLEYESVEGAESLLNASQKNPIKMGERVLQIERRTKDGSANKGPRDSKPKSDKPRGTGPKPAGSKPSPKPAPAH